MEKFKTEQYDTITFQSKGVIDTEVPKLLVDVIQTALNNLPADEDGKIPWIVTPVMTNPNLKEISFGLISQVPPSKFEYVVTIKTKEYWDNIYERLKEHKTLTKPELNCPCAVVIKGIGSGAELPKECSCEILQKMIEDEANKPK
jgi:hypothetical protein